MDCKAQSPNVKETKLAENGNIPRVIHYCWFGGAPLPSSAKKCIASWKKYLPGYEIKEWNEGNFDLHCCRYVEEASNAKKWAFVSDYARFKILYDYGGLYFDTDVEVLKPLDAILARGGFMGVEGYADLDVNPGLGLAVAPGLGLYKELFEAYHTRRFINDDGSMNLKTVVQYTTECLAAHGLTDSCEIQFVAGVYIYPKEYFCPKNYLTGELDITENTYTIHHYSSSWLSGYKRAKIKIYQIARRVLGGRAAESIRNAVKRKKD